MVYKGSSTLPLSTNIFIEQNFNIMTKLSFAQRFSAEVINSKFGKYRVTYSTPTKEFISFTDNKTIYNEIAERFELSAKRLRGIRTAIYYGI